jgi:hypothetical protein
VKSFLLLACSFVWKWVFLQPLSCCSMQQNFSPTFKLSLCRRMYFNGYNVEIKKSWWTMWNQTVIFGPNIMNFHCLIYWLLIPWATKVWSFFFTHSTTAEYLRMCISSSPSQEVHAELNFHIYPKLLSEWFTSGLHTAMPAHCCRESSQFCCSCKSSYLRRLSIIKSGSIYKYM